MKKEILRELADALIEILDEEEANEYNKIIECEIQKAHQDWLREEIVKLKGMEVTIREDADTTGYNFALQTIIDRYQKELDQLTRDDWNEDMERSHTLAELDQDKKDCEHYQAMQEGAAVGLDQEGKCVDCGVEVLRTDTNK